MTLVAEQPCCGKYLGEATDNGPNQLNLTSLFSTFRHFFSVFKLVESPKLYGTSIIPSVATDARAGRHCQSRASTVVQWQSVNRIKHFVLQCRLTLARVRILVTCYIRYLTHNLYYAF